ncbi:hypothetical protein H6F43_13420 [Leptolyngbya sp. FACHB-36]|nr:hypothetical protein [Leptolyngbya sp. FACHB-36]
MAYTVYYLVSGGTSAIGVSLCDPIPQGTSLIANTAQVQTATGAPTAGGTVFSPLAPLPSGNSCPNQSNPNGAVIFNLGDLSGASGSNFGFVRFRVRVN